MFLASDVVCLKGQPDVLGIVESLGNEEEAAAQDLDPNEVGLEIFWPSKDIEACTSIETAATVDIVDRAFLSGDVVSRVDANPPMVGSIQVPIRTIPFSSPRSNMRF